MNGIFELDGLHSIHAGSLWLIRDISADDMVLNLLHIVLSICCSVSVRVVMSGCCVVFNTIPSFSPTIFCS